MPITTIMTWLEKEKAMGSPYPDRIVLATAGSDGVPHSRIVAIREINVQGILFFTQRGSRKTHEIAENPQASMTLWLPLQQREIILEGRIEALTQEENNFYWSQRPRDRQLHFAAYAPTSGQAIVSKQQLRDQYQRLTQLYAAKDVPLSEYYCGYRLIPASIVFYTLDDSDFSEIQKFTQQKGKWTSQLLSP